MVISCVNGVNMREQQKKKKEKESERNTQWNYINIVHIVGLITGSAKKNISTIGTIRKHIMNNNTQQKMQYCK